jgi:hypothetical protein
MLVFESMEEGDLRRYMDTEGDRGTLKPSWLGHLCTTGYNR